MLFKISCQGNKLLHKGQLLTITSRSQPYCTTCYRGLFQIPKTIKLEACEKCRLVFTCTSCPSSHTTEECKIWQRFADVEIFRISFFNETVRTFAEYQWCSLNLRRVASTHKALLALQGQPTKLFPPPQVGETSTLRFPTKMKLSAPMSTQI